MRAYKVFTIGEGGKLHSTMTRGTIYDIIYTPGEVSRGYGGSKLFVCKEKADALHWASCYSIILDNRGESAPETEVWEVKVGDSLERCHVVYDVLGLRTTQSLSDHLIDFWKRWVEGGVNTPNRDRLKASELWATRGAYVCDWVKPISKVEGATEQCLYTVIYSSPSISSTMTWVSASAVVDIDIDTNG